MTRTRFDHMADAKTSDDTQKKVGLELPHGSVQRAWAH